MIESAIIGLVIVVAVFIWQFEKFRKETIDDIELLQKCVLDNDRKIKKHNQLLHYIINLFRSKDKLKK